VLKSPRLRQDFLKLLFAFLACQQTAHGANSELVYRPLAAFGPAPSAVFQTALADLNNDGNADLVRLVNSSQVSVQLGLGDGTFGAATFAAAGGQPFVLVVADLNQDNVPDLVVGNSDGSEAASILIGNGNGTFQPRVTSNLGLTATAIAVTDFTKDGKPDLIATGYPNSPTEGYVSTLVGNGGGTFASPQTFQASSRSLLTLTRDVAAADLNGDTYPDFVVTAPANGFALISFLNNGNGTFTRAYEMQVGNVGRLALSDFNGDGLPDMAVTLVSDPALGQTAEGSNVAVAMGNGNGSFGSLSLGPPLYSLTEGAAIYGVGGDSRCKPESSLVAADMDGDGIRDLVLSTYAEDGSTRVGVLRGVGNGTFTEGKRRVVQNNVVWTSVADLNGDNAPDYVATPNSADTQAYLAGSNLPALAVTSANGASFISGSNNSFTVTAAGPLTPALSVSGALPAGVTFSSGNLLSGVPAAGTEGVYPLTITATDAYARTAVQSFTLSVSRVDLVVTTAVDEDNGTPDPGTGTGASLREIVNFANSLPGPQTIVFSPSLAGQSINLSSAGDTTVGNSALRVTGNLTIQGLTAGSGVTVRRSSGGALRLFLVGLGASLTVNDLTLADGDASGSFGGAVYNLGTLRMNRCTVRNNRAAAGGALASGGGGSGQTMTLTNCTIVSNEAAGAGGGIQNQPGSTLALTNVTLTGNTLTGSPSGAGLANDGSAVLINTIVAGNSFAGDDADLGGTVSGTSHHNLIGAPAGGLVNGVNGNLTGIQDPRLGPLAANGGPTQTSALLGSAAVNAGAVVAGVTTDQRGVVRPQLGAPDIGAFEFDGVLNESLVVTTPFDEADVTSDATFGRGTSLREALAYAATRSAPSVITFSPALESIGMVLTRGWNDAADATALRVSGQVTLQGPTDFSISIVPLNNSVEKRLLLVEPTGNLQVSNLTFIDGTADRGGAIQNFGHLAVRNCTFTGNHATLDGGALHSATTALSLLVENSTFSGNSADANSSALASGTAQTTCRHLTVTGNSGGGGAMLLFQNQVTLVNSLVAGNSPDGIIAQSGAAFSSQSTNNLFGPGGSGGLVHGVNGNQVGIAANQLFLGSLAGNGGPTPTVALQPGSPALNAGTVAANPATDQRGIGRPQGPATDIGAYEFVITPPVFTSANRALFATGQANSFSVTATSQGAAAFSLSGNLPAGVTFTSAGLLSGTPAAGTEGDYPVAITATSLGVGTTQNFTLTVSSYNVIVTTTVDEDNGGIDPAAGTGTSLREAVNYANAQSQPQTIGFSPALAGQTIGLTTAAFTGNGPTALLINQDITIQGLVGNAGITISRAVTSDLRFFQGTFPFTLNDLTLSNGKAAGFGGVMWMDGPVRLNRCTLTGNSGSRGGAIAIGSFSPFPASLTMTNCTLTQNTASFTGGAIDTFANATVSLTNVTIAGNVTNTDGGGIYSRGSLLAVNSIFAGNTLNGSTPSDIVATSALDPSSHHNLIGIGGSGGLVDGVNGNRVGVADARLGPLSANGGPAPTMALLGGPAINGGATVSGVATDQRGVARPQFGTPDIGAYEVDGTLAPSLVVTTATDESDFSSDPRFGAGTSLREAVAHAQSLGGAPTITFAPALQGQTVTLVDGATGAADDTALRITSDLTLDGGAGVTVHLAAPVPRRHLLHGAGRTLTLRNLTFSGGDIRTVNDGGALYNLGAVVMSNVHFTNNRANHGGAVWNAGQISIAGSTFESNATAANGQGGAIWSNGTLTADASTFYLNSAGQLGGAIASFAGLTVTNCNFSTNHSDFNGGAVRLDGPAAISGSVFTNNTAENGGGAIMSHGATTLTNVTIGYNTALDGGGIQFFDGTATVRHATIAHNAASRFGGGIAVNFANVTLTNTLTAANGETSPLGSFHPASSNNLLDLTETQAGLGAIGIQGGTTSTFPLLPASPAINAGATIAGITTDQRGFARSAGGLPDIGAFEDATGDDDPDRDSLTNLAEFQLGTAALSLDTDGDGFNDATETLNGTDPTAAGSQPGATRIERVLGIGPARGLDLSGNFVRAASTHGNTAGGTLGDAVFTSGSVAGVTYNPGSIESGIWTTRDFGDTAADDLLEELCRSHRFSGPTPGLQVGVANLVPGREYQLQLLFADPAAYQRVFNVSVNGSTIATDFNPGVAQGTSLKPYAAAVIVHTFTATSASLDVLLSAASATGAFDPNPFLSAFTLEELPAPPTALDLWRAVHGLPSDGSQDLANPSGDGVENLLKYAFNLAPDAGDLLQGDVRILPPGGSAGLPRITRDEEGRLVIEFVRRKAATLPMVDYIVETGADLADLQPLDLGDATVESIDAAWERITVTDPVTSAVRFGRLRVEPD
jgi:predicted outer membrane repeat protein